jgi:hypothetical protein
MNMSNLYNPDLFRDNFMYALKVTGLITAATLLLALPFALFFPPAAMVILYLGMCVCSFYFFVCIYRVAVGDPIDGSTKGVGKLTAQEYIELRRAKDDYEDERRAKQNAKLKKVFDAVFPTVKRLLKLSIIASGLLILLFVVSVVVTLVLQA